MDDIPVIEGGQDFKILLDFYKKEQGLEQKTDLTGFEIKNIAVISFLSDYAEVPEFKDMINYILELKISKDRQGRKEFFESFKQLKEYLKDKQNPLEALRGGVR